MILDGTPRRHRPFAGRVAVAVVGLSAIVGAADAADAATVPPEPSEAPLSPVTVLDAGDQTLTIQLPGLPAEGDAASRTTVMTTTGSVVMTGTGGGTVDVDVTTTAITDAEVLAARGDGYDVRRIVRSYDTVDHSVGGDGRDYQVDPQLAQLVGLPLVATMGADGSLVALVTENATDVTADEQAAIDATFDSFNPYVFPDVPTGVGARWTATFVNGPLEVAATYTLVEIDGEEYTVDVAAKGSFASLVENNQLPAGFDDASGRFTRHDRFTAHLGELFPRSSVTTVRIELAMTGPSADVTIDLTRVVEETALAG